MSAYLKLPRRKKNTSTANGFRRVPYKNICSKTVIHVIPEKKIKDVNFTVANKFGKSWPFKRFYPLSIP